METAQLERKTEYLSEAKKYNGKDGPLLDSYRVGTMT